MEPLRRNSSQLRALIATRMLGTKQEIDTYLQRDADGKTLSDEVRKRLVTHLWGFVHNMLTDVERTAREIGRSEVLPALPNYCAECGAKIPVPELPPAPLTPRDE